VTKESKKKLEAKPKMSKSGTRDQKKKKRKAQRDKDIQKLMTL